MPNSVWLATGPLYVRTDHPLGYLLNSRTEKNFDAKIQRRGRRKEKRKSPLKERDKKGYQRACPPATVDAKKHVVSPETREDLIHADAVSYARRKRRSAGGSDFPDRQRVLLLRQRTGGTGLWGKRAYKCREQKKPPQHIPQTATECPPLTFRAPIR